MLKCFRNILILFLMTNATVFALSTSDLMRTKSNKIYIDDEEFNAKNDAFHIHVGNNVWLVTNTVHRDASGLYTYENDLIRSMGGGNQMAYERKWKCPYCYNYWPIGTACQNPDCPSKYR